MAVPDFVAVWLQCCGFMGKSSSIRATWSSCRFRPNRLVFFFLSFVWCFPVIFFPRSLFCDKSTDLKPRGSGSLAACSVETSSRRMGYKISYAEQVFATDYTIIPLLAETPKNEPVFKTLGRTTSRRSGGGKFTVSPLWNLYVVFYNNENEKKRGWGGKKVRPAMLQVGPTPSSSFYFWFHVRPGLPSMQHACVPFSVRCFARSILYL